MLVEVPLAALWGWMIYNEGLTTITAMGGILILLSAVILIKKSKNA